MITNSLLLAALLFLPHSASGAVARQPVRAPVKAGNAVISLRLLDAGGVRPAARPGLERQQALLRVQRIATEAEAAAERGADETKLVSQGHAMFNGARDESGSGSESEPPGSGSGGGGSQGGGGSGSNGEWPAKVAMFSMPMVLMPGVRVSVTGTVLELKAGSLVVLVADDESGSPSLHATIAKVYAETPGEGAAEMYVAEGLRRVKIADVERTEAGLVSNLEYPEDRPSKPEAVKNLMDVLVQLARGLGMVFTEDILADPGRFTYGVAQVAPIPESGKLKVLAGESVEERLATLVQELTSRNDKQLRRGPRREEGNPMHALVARNLKQMEKSQEAERETEDEREELRERIESAGLSAEAKEEALRQFKKLGRMNPVSAEYEVSLSYLDFMLELPWKQMAPVNADAAHAKAVLQENHYGLDEVNRRVVENLAVMARNANRRGKILCLVGAPGVGKTSVTKDLARATGRPLVTLKLGGVRDEAEIRGHRSTYIGSMAGKPLQRMQQAKVKNPLMLLDEIDKMGADSFRGDPASALLELVDPTQNASFEDHYLRVGFDFSKVMFVATANYPDKIPAALKDRMEFIEIPAYTEDQKVEIAVRHLEPRWRAENGMKDGEGKLTVPALRRMIRSYTREAGVRGLEKLIDAVHAKLIYRADVDGAPMPAEVTEEHVAELLGPERVSKKEAAPNGLGRTTGLAWTAVGGVTLNLEVQKVPGRGNPVLRDQMKETMPDSFRNAFAWAVAEARKRGVPEQYFRKHDFHIQIVPGEDVSGPSAGTAAGIAFLSFFLDRPVKPAVAFTGEITVQGQVLPIGGLKEKTIAASQLGIKQVYIPEKNRADLEKIPADVREKIEIDFVTQADQLVDRVLEPAGGRR